MNPFDPMNFMNAIGSLFQFDFEAILTDPARLGAFLTLVETIAELEPRAREAAISLAMAGKEIPGWSLVRKEGNKFVESHLVLRLLEECPTSRLSAVLEAVTKVIGNVGEKKWQQLCEAAGRQDGERDFNQAGAKAFLRRRPSEGNQTSNQERS
jgi:hypothetical protein